MDGTGEHQLKLVRLGKPKGTFFLTHGLETWHTYKQYYEQQVYGEPIYDRERVKGGG